MNTSSTSIFSKSQITNEEMLPSCVLHVCTSCRMPGTSRLPKEGRSGFILYEKLRDSIITRDLKHLVEVRAAKCLSICPRPCGIALSSLGSWTYLFGDQQADKEGQEIIDCISTYLNSPDGFMARASRPQSLQSSVLGRVPPIIGDQTCT